LQGGHRIREEHAVKERYWQPVKYFYRWQDFFTFSIRKALQRGTTPSPRKMSEYSTPWRFPSVESQFLAEDRPAHCGSYDNFRTVAAQFSARNSFKR
jgi:hypothetical protein